MSQSDPWSLLERLNDPATPPEERRALEVEIAHDPVLAARLETFRILTEWPDLEGSTPPSSATVTLLQRLEGESEGLSLDREIRRAFPFVALAALAATITLAVINLNSVQDYTSSTLEALFGLPQPTLDQTILANL